MVSGVIGSRSHSVSHPPSLTCSALRPRFHTRTVSPAQPSARLCGRPDNTVRHAMQWHMGVPARTHDSCRGPLLICNSSAAGAIPLPSESGEQSSLLATIRAVMFYSWTLLLSVPLFAIMLLQAPFALVFDKVRRLAQHHVNNIWAIISTTPFYKVEIEGRENLPAKDEPAVYVANHQSFLDIYSLFHLDRPFKFISKTSNFAIPIVGWSMFLTGHVMINRVDNRSMMKCLLKCNDLLKQGASVLFFPEGTRSKDGKMAAFKKGAFSIAQKAKVPVIPITLIGTGRLMPNGKEGRLYWGSGVKIVVHPRIEAGTPADQQIVQARKAIASRIPPELVA